MKALLQLPLIPVLGMMYFGFWFVIVWAASIWGPWWQEHGVDVLLFLVRAFFCFGHPYC